MPASLSRAGPCPAVGSAPRAAALPATPPACGARRQRTPLCHPPAPAETPVPCRSRHQCPPTRNAPREPAPPALYPGHAGSSISAPARSPEPPPACSAPHPRATCAEGRAAYRSARSVVHPTRRQIPPLGSCPPLPSQGQALSQPPGPLTRNANRTLTLFDEAGFVDDQATFRRPADKQIRVLADLRQHRLVIPWRIAD